MPPSKPLEGQYHLHDIQDSCDLKLSGSICREATNECDLPEFCSGNVGSCPIDVFKKNGHPCASGEGFCFNGQCPALNQQCRQIWGYGGMAADRQCFEQFNSKGSINGHCGTDRSGHFIKCEADTFYYIKRPCGNKKIPLFEEKDSIVLFNDTCLTPWDKKFLKHCSYLRK
ncbi:hypothetical protein TKK_0018644 [Trichogramma kaykai]